MYFVKCEVCGSQRPVMAAVCPTCVTRSFESKGHRGWYDLLDGWFCYRLCSGCCPDGYIE